MTNLRLKEVAKEANNKEFFNSFFTASKVTKLIGLFGQFISALTEFHFIFSAVGGVYQLDITVKNIVAAGSGLAAIYIFEIVGVRVYLVRIIRQIVNKDFSTNERKVLFVFNMFFVISLCGSNLLISYLGQKHTFATVTNVTTTDKTFELSNDKTKQLQLLQTSVNEQLSELQETYNRDKKSIEKRYTSDIYELKNNRYAARENKVKYNNYTTKIDEKLQAKTNDLAALTQSYNDSKQLINNAYKSDKNDIKQSFDSRINDVSSVENSKIDLILIVQRYTLPLLLIFILLSWFAIVYVEIFQKGSEQKIEVIEVEKRPILFIEFAKGLYEKFYKKCYDLVAKFLGSVKYEFKAIQQEKKVYNINTSSSLLTSKNEQKTVVRQIGFNKSYDTNSNDINNEYSNISNNVFNSLNDAKNDTNETKNDSKNLSTNDNRITKVVTFDNSHNRTCKNCQKPFTYKHHKQLYCKDACRIAAWEQRTGKKLKKKSKKS